MVAKLFIAGDQVPVNGGESADEVGNAAKVVPEQIAEFMAKLPKKESYTGKVEKKNH